jgi:hypothetical protein
MKSANNQRVLMALLILVSVGCEEQNRRAAENARREREADREHLELEFRAQEEVDRIESEMSREKSQR